MKFIVFILAIIIIGYVVYLVGSRVFGLVKDGIEARKVDGETATKALGEAKAVLQSIADDSVGRPDLEAQIALDNLSKYENNNKE